jgi:uncharacterized protein (TIGR02246 family)
MKHPPTAIDFPARWMARVCEGDVSAILALYEPDAVLVPTYGRAVLRGRVELGGYFRTFTADRPGLCGRIDTATVQGGAGRTRVVSGTYTFAWDGPDGPESAAARYTFVLVPSRKNGWRILTHHSSAKPA